MDHLSSTAFLQPATSRVGAEIAARDWRATSLGPVEGWPVSLRTTLATMMACPTAMFLAWGPELLCFYNDAYETLLSDSVEGGIGRPFPELWSSLWDDISPLVEAALAGGQPRVTDMRLIIPREGLPPESFWTFSYSPAFDDAGRIAGMLCVTMETTARVTAERESRESEARLSMALSAGRGIGIWDWDVPADEIRADERFARLYGVDPALAARGASLEQFFQGIHPEDRARLTTEIAVAMAGDQPFMSEYRLLRPDGSIVWVSAQGRAVRDAAGRCIRFPGVSFDITERKQQELAIRRAKEEREFVLDLIVRQRGLADPDAILSDASAAIGRWFGADRVGFYRVHPGETLLHGNGWSASALLPLIGTQPADAFGIFAGDERRQGRTLVFADSRAEAGGRLAAYAEDGAIAGICVPLMNEGVWAAGIYLHQARPRAWTKAEVGLAEELAQLTWSAVERAQALLRLSELVDLQGSALQRRMSELQAQTDRREAAEGQLRQMQKMDAVGQLTGGIAHDFNNMLAVIIGGLNLTRRRLARGETDVAEFIDGALDGANRASALTHRLLAFARQQPLAPHSIDLNTLIGGLTDLLARSLGEQVTLETRLSPGLWKAKVDPNQLENAIINLAVNARDAMPEGGRLLIRTANAQVGAPEARAAEMEAGQYVTVTVTDTGTGMTPEVLAHAFEPFFTTKGVGKGTGLGLSQVFGFLRQSGGHVRIESEPGRGTTVRLYLPRFWGEGAAPVPRRPAEPRAGQPSEVVLVVEDEERVRNLTVASVRELGYSVVETGRGGEALEILASRPEIRLLLTDVVMPEMTGRQLADRALAIRPGLRVVFTTGYTRNAVVNDGLLDPGTLFLPKPFSLDDLAARLREALDGG